MPTRERPSDRGRRRLNEARSRLGGELRRGRLAAGLSLREVARATGVDHVRIWRFERGSGELSLGDIGAVAAVVGLDVVLRAYPAGDAIRDAAHARLLERLRRELDPSLRWNTEVPFPIPGDLRAWDAVTGNGEWRLAIEAETVIDDTQVLDRRLAQKRRDGLIDHMLLLVADTRRNRANLAASPAAFGDLAVSPRVMLAALRAGRDPGGSGIVVL